MGRDIKFRGWDSVNEVMLQVESINFREGYVSLNEGDNSLTDTLEMIELMQYTGLNDKDGKEIWEGDILERYGYWSIRIEYDKGCLMVRDLDEVRYNNLILNVPICNFESINDWKVIGNIYENPELLEG
ncbi:YopX family protein [Clostridium sp.]|nr:YopX family protein [Clostridium sp.]MDU4427641.1 YopX family protein [Clostridium sp.]MDU7458750.1 YopX family protein [Clostridium perfringens]